MGGFFEQSPWNLLPLSDVCGRKEAAKPETNPDSYFQYVDIASVSNELFQITAPKELLGRDAPSRARKRIRTGDVIFATTRPYLKSIAQVPECLNEQVCSTGFCVLRPTEKVDFDWLFYLAISDDFMHQILPKMRGANYPAVSDSDVLAAKVPVPTLAEQHRVVGCIRECMKRIDEIQELRAGSIKEAEALLPALLNEEFSKLKEASPSSIEDITIQTKYGTSNKCSPNNSGTPILRIPNVSGGKIDFSDLKYLPCEVNEDDSLLLCDGDILVVRTNDSPELVGRCAVFKEQEKPLGFASYLIRIRVDFERVNPQFLAYFLSSTQGRDQIAERRRTSAGQFNINTANLKSITFPCPSIDEQQDLVERMNAIREASLRTLEEQRSNAVNEAAMVSAILRKAFAGEF